MVKVIVMSADPTVRAAWAKELEAGGSTTIRCVGPQVLCILLSGEGGCPLHRQADVALYDEASVTDQLMLRLLRTRTAIPIALAKDVVSPTGDHEPRVTKVVPTADLREFSAAGLFRRR